MKCHHFIQKHCLSCDLLAHDYLSSIKLKETEIARLFPNHVDKIKPSVICDLGAEGTRNKAKLAVAHIQKQIEFGFYDNQKQFKKLEDCPLHASAINSTLFLLKDLLSTYKIAPYDLFLKTGELKFVLITYSESARELLIRFILRSKDSVAKLKKLSADLLKLNPLIKVITANIQPVHQAILEGDEEIVLTKDDYITHYFDDVALYQGPRSFFQTNSAMAHKLYQQFQNEISTLSINNFLDLYCGVGAFSFFAKKYCANVVGIEISDAAIFYANKAREKNNSENIHFTTMDVELFLQNNQSTSFDAVMVNPPRRGLNNAIINQLLKLAPTHLFYSSCNAETLSRDLLQLESDYQLQSLQLFDMFPFTSHFETLAVLKKNSN